MRYLGTVYRMVDPRWSYAPDSGKGAKQRGRFNRVGQEALYTSLDYQTAFKEVQYGLPRPQPYVICAFEVDCEDILDLTDPLICSNWGISQADLACNWRYISLVNHKDPPTWLMVDQLLNKGIAGIKVRSFAKTATSMDTNIVFWAWKISQPHQVKIIDDATRLPKNPASWQKSP